MMKKSLFIILFTISFSYAQKYPYWFLHQGEYPNSVVGYSSFPLYPDSAVSYAFQDAAINYSLLKYCEVEGRAESWATELGNFLITQNITINFDTLYDYFANNYEVADSAFIDNFVIVLTVPKNSDYNVNSETIDVAKLSKPSWTEIEKGEKVALGVTSNKHYYEAYAWKYAVSEAIKKLAYHKIIIQNESGRVFNGNGDFIRQSEINCTLNNLSVISRWFDSEDKIYYVLIKEN